MTIEKCQELYKKIKNQEDIIGFILGRHYQVISFNKEFLTIGCHKIPTIEVLKYGKIIE